jgi:hypothetical protein
VVCSFATDHVYEVCDDLFRPEKRAIHPPSSLLHQCHHIGRRISESLGVGHVGKLIIAINLDVNLQAHYSVFSEVLVRLCARWHLSPGHILEKGVEGTTFNGFPSEDTIRTWQHLGEAKPRLACFVRSVPHLVFKELRCLYQVSAHTTFIAAISAALTTILVCIAQINLNFTAAAAALWIVPHVGVQL